MAAVRSDSRGDHHFYAAPAGVDRLFVASRSFGDDPVLRSMGSAFHLSGDRDLSVVQTLSQSSDAVVVAESALPRSLFCGSDGMAGCVYFYCVFLALSALLR